jgi:hypothetical protein
MTWNGISAWLYGLQTVMPERRGGAGRGRSGNESSPQQFG